MIQVLIDFDGVSPSMMRCRSFLLVLSSARTRSSDKEDKVRTKISQNPSQILLANIFPLIFASLFADCVLQQGGHNQDKNANKIQILVDQNTCSGA